MKFSSKIEELIENNVIYENDPPDGFINEVSNEVWKKNLFRKKKILSKYKNYLPETYLESLELLGYNEYSIPSLSKMNNYLKSFNWRLVWAKDLSIHDFCLLTANRIFPIKASHRRLDEIEFALYPDFIHDLWGHVPLLNINELSMVIEKLSKAFISYEISEVDDELYEELYGENIEAKEQINEPLNESNILHPKKLLSKLFLLTVEFGLLKKSNNFHIFGGGILSSVNEFENITSNETEKYNLTFSSLCDKKFNYFEKQKKYFYINNYSDIYEILDKILEIK